MSTFTIERKHAVFMNKPKAKVNVEACNGTTVVVADDPMEYCKIDRADFREELTYFNHTTKNVYVISRSGIPITIAPCPPTLSRDFIIRKILYLRGDSLSSAITYINSQADFDDVEAAVLKEKIKHLYSGPSYYVKITVMLDFVITPEEFNLYANQTFFHHQTNKVISFSPCIDNTIHKDSTKYTDIRDFGRTYEYSHTDDLDFKIRYVTNKVDSLPVYIKILGKVLTLHPQKDKPPRLSIGNGKKLDTALRDEYIHIFYSSSCDQNNRGNAKVLDYTLTMKEAHVELGIYNTYAEALHSDSDTRAKQILQQNENELLLAKQQFTKQKHDLEVIILSLERDKQIQKAENEVISEKFKTIEHIRKMDEAAIDYSNTLLNKNVISVKFNNDLALANLNLEALLIKQKQVLVDIEASVIETDRRIKQDVADLANKTLQEQIARERDLHEYRMKLNAAHLKDYYEQRTQVRKDTSDSVKLIPGLIIAIGAIAGLLLKSK